mmetsp:Transcript_52419/g.67227  ORF Transcript_52419/g.67227 Transcript_52419/m.67227 type:complete len:166 (+) Transcript_52419:153-650(+)
MNLILQFHFRRGESLFSQYLTYIYYLFETLFSATFHGAKKGFVYKKGEKGLGYYKDEILEKKEAPKKQSPVKPPNSSHVKLELIHQHKQSEPHSIEATLLLEPAFEIKNSTDIKIECDNDSKKLILSSKKWSNKVEVVIHYEIYQEKTQAWLNDKQLTIRLPIRL